MRAHPRLSLKPGVALALLIVAGCAGKHATESGPTPTPLPLGSCETRIMDFDGVEAVVTSNVDASLASVDVVHAPDAASRAKAIDDAIHYFGPVRRDNRVTLRQSRWLVATLSDPCGRPVAPPSPPAQK
ncbi:MAG: hypothetical protein JO192_06080 [Candidatus Eremiobacteraeota bacterium]|nr:hypothetical protein [Candidatus Eremiobacteraeota bacterium]